VREDRWRSGGIKESQKQVAGAQRGELSGPGRVGDTGRAGLAGAVFRVQNTGAQFKRAQVQYALGPFWRSIRRPAIPTP